MAKRLARVSVAVWLRSLGHQAHRARQEPVARACGDVVAIRGS